MASVATITESELLEALSAAMPGQTVADCSTIAELVRSTGLSERRVTRGLRAIKAEGRLVVHRVPRESLDGRRVIVAAYAMLPSPQQSTAKRKR